MSNTNIRARRVSGQQLDVLWEFLNSHRNIAVAYNRSLQAKEYSKRKWTEIADALNAQGVGAHKNWKEWSKYWVDYKAKLKKKASALRSAQSATGGWPSTEQPLSDIDKKFLQILGEDFGQGLPGVRVEPFPEASTSTDATISGSILLREPLSPGLLTESRDLMQETPLQEVLCQRLAEPTVRMRSPLSSPHALASSAPRSPAPAPAEHSPPPPPAPAPTARSPRRLRRMREPPMTQEMARRALVESSRLRAEAAVRSSHALESMQNTLQRIERFIHDAFPRAGERENFA